MLSAEGLRTGQRRIEEFPDGGKGFLIHQGLWENFDDTPVF